MPKYTVSSFGRQYVIDEELDELPTTRWVFMLVTFLLGFGTLLRFLSFYRGITTRKPKTCNYLPLSYPAKRIVWCYIISHLIHTIHFIDNIYRPVDYFEPKWLYDRIILSEMEITFFANFPITLCGLIFMEKFVTSISKRNLPNALDACKQMSWYIFGSFLTLGHYRTEPPWNYSLSTTFTIAGEGVATLVLAVWIYLYFKHGKGRLSQGWVDEEESASVKQSSKTL
ncbi:unnamed protein product [Orchesella dallaii]|uniref:Uncharacterized protein n=1 Tax=Orchesella dallaii TaxID=48710 RepID=A0ABP1Q4N5_9HEXA